MSNRCGGCGKMASLELEEPEVEQIEIDEAGAVSGTVRVYLTSACCGEEMKERSFDFEDEDEEVGRHVHDHQEAGEEYELTVEEEAVEATDRYQTTDRNGKQIKSYRYMRHYYGFRLEYAVGCSCGWTAAGEVDDEEQASGFDELNW